MSSKFALSLIIFVHFALATLYSVTTPIFGSYDEPGHYEYARYVATHRRLPSRDEIVQGRQPPLYYLPIAVAIAGIDTSDNLQPKFALGSRIMVVPDLEHDRWPWHGTALALHIGRLVSALLSCFGVFFTYKAAQQWLVGNGKRLMVDGQWAVGNATPSLTINHLPLTTNRLPLTAALVYACWPMFLHLSGAITNDVGIGVMGALVLWRMLCVWHLPSVRNGIWLAVSLVLALLTKDSGLSLVAFAGLVCLGLVYQRRTIFVQWAAQNRRAAALLIAAGLMLLAGGVWASQGRIAKQVSDAVEFISTAFNPYASHTVAEQPRPYDRLRALVEAVQSYLPAMIFRTTYGLFGWGHAQMSLPDSWYNVALLGWGLCLFGFILDFRFWILDRFIPSPESKIQNPKSKILWLCLVCVVAAPFVRAAYYADYTIMIGRYYMPALAALSLLIAGGLARLPRWLRRIGSLYVVGGIAMTALMTPFVVLAPMYRPPVLLDPIAAPVAMQVPQSFIFGDAIQLLGYSQPQPKVSAGGFAPITLYWRALKPMPQDYLLQAEAFEVSGRSLGRSAQVHPGEGTFPTSHWRVGDTFAQTIFVPVGDASATRITFRLNWLDVERRQPIIALDAAPKVGAIAIAPAADAAAMARSADARQHAFQLTAPNTANKHIHLLASQQVKSGDNFALRLWWQAKADKLPPATVFLHVLDAQGKLVAQLDAPMRGGIYPAELWADGEVVLDTLSLSLPNLPAGELRLRLGLYDPVWGQRWAVSGGTLADAIDLGVFVR